MPTKDRVVFLLTYSAPHKKSKPFVCAGGSMVARLKPEGTDGRAAAPGVEPPISGVVNGSKSAWAFLFSAGNGKIPIFTPTSVTIQYNAIE